MQTSSVWPHVKEAEVRALRLQKHAQSIHSIRSCLWQIKGLIVLYQNYRNQLEHKRYDLHNLDVYNLNIKQTLNHLIWQCDQACIALSNSDLDRLTQHVQESERLYRQLHIEAGIFKNIVAKSLPTSRM